ncbi:MAG: hypothetical protein KGI33_01220 [Thaumarchaeota archaeon]|nr:hypothetical protein [Nitrososphaerota archaeon]
MEKYNQVQEKFNLIIESFIHTAKDAKERISIIQNEPDGSQEQKIQLEVLYKHVVPYMDKLGSVVYGTILTYNKFPELLPSLTDKDILKAQTALDDCIANLQMDGVTHHIHFSKDPVFQ